MWVKALSDWDWRERPSALVAYKKDKVYNVPKKAGDLGIELGKFEATSAPKKNDVRDERTAVRPRADGQNVTPTEADLGEPEGAAGSAQAAGTATPAGGTPSAT